LFIPCLALDLPPGTNALAYLSGDKSFGTLTTTGPRKSPNKEQGTPLLRGKSFFIVTF
jgi:hypothetical protein